MAVQFGLKRLENPYADYFIRELSGQDVVDILAIEQDEHRDSEAKNMAIRMEMVCRAVHDKDGNLVFASAMDVYSAPWNFIVLASRETATLSGIDLDVEEHAGN